ncbi:MAG: hypothetical protein WC455_29665 [Dehalococcoidia bacterium]|jgi:hypothetical protein
MTEALGTFHRDAVQEFAQEFPDRAATVDALIASKQIAVIVDEQAKGGSNGSNSSKK